MKIGKLRIKMLAVAFALLPTAGLGESFAQTFKGGKAIHDYFLVKDKVSYLLYQVDLFYPKDGSPELQRCLSRMVFGIERDSVQGAYEEWQRQLGRQSDLNKAGVLTDIPYRRLLRMVNYVPGRYAVFSSVADSDYEEYDSEERPQKRFGYKTDYSYLEFLGGAGYVSRYLVRQVLTNEKAVIFDLRKNKPLVATDVFTADGIKKLGIDTLGAEVNLILIGRNLLYGNSTCCLGAKLDALKEYLTDYFKDLADIDGKLNLSSGVLKPDDGDVYEGPLDEEPSFPGGDKARDKWWKKNYKTPKKAVALKAAGTVGVSMIVEPDGSLTSVRIDKPAHPLLDLTALKTILKMPKWKPGMKDGKPVRARTRLLMSLKYDNVYANERFMHVN